MASKKAKSLDQQKINQLNQKTVELIDQGQYDQARDIARQAIDLAKQLFDENPLVYAVSLNNLAGVYEKMGLYGQVVDLYHEVLDIKRGILEEENKSIARTLNNLAYIYQATGDYVRAESLYLEASEILRNQDDLEFAKCLNNLAGLYKAMRSYSKAKPLQEQVIRIIGKTLGKNHPLFAVSLGNLAELFWLEGDYAQAKPLYKRAIKILRNTIGQDHPLFATFLNGLALLYQSVGDYKKAETHYHKALEIKLKALGENHPEIAQIFNNLAFLYKVMGNYTQAENFFQQALTVQRAIFGENHPTVALNLYTLADLYVAIGRPQEALKLMVQAAVIIDQLIGQIFCIGSDSQRMAYLIQAREEMAAVLSLVLQHLMDHSETLQIGFALLLRRKALGAEALVTQQDAMISGRYPELITEFQKLNTLRQQIIQKMLAGPGPEGLKRHQELLAEWTVQKEQLEAALARQIPEMNLAQKLHSITPQVIAAALPQNTTLVEFVRLRIYNFLAKPLQGERYWEPAHYLAFVLRNETPDDLKMIDLGDADVIDRMITAFHSAITGEMEHRGLFYGGEIAAETTVELEIGLQLRAIVFDPLLPALGDCHRLFLSPDGDLSRLPFEVLPTQNGHRLIDDYQISYLGVGRDVLRFGVQNSGQGTKSIVLADPNFDLASNPETSAEDQTDGIESSIDQQPVSSNRRSKDFDRAGLYFGRLTGTRIEGEQVATLLGVSPIVADAVLERTLKTINSPLILHIATHGFFLPDQKRDPNEEQVDFTLSSRGATNNWGRLSHGLENPLLRSGLALAGANTWLKGENLPPEAEDGLLTAEDVTSLDLLATDLVVLSACETGLGEVQVGEGVFGLRRAFVLAGAKTLVMSLWKIPDQQTQELMIAFYRCVLVGEPRAEALRQAQLAMKEKYPNPLYWGAFICQGEPGPLSK